MNSRADVERAMSVPGASRRTMAFHPGHEARPHRKAFPMRNANIEPAGLIVPRNRGVRTAVLILTLVVFATGVSLC